MEQKQKTDIEQRIVDVLKTVYDPEIPVNINMTFTAPNCPAADFILDDVRTKIESLEGIRSANINLVFEPAWDQSMMSEEARVELGFD